MGNVGTGIVGQPLQGSGVGKSPTFAAIGLNSGLTAHGVVISENLGAFASTAAATTGQVLTGVTGADPVWSSPATSGTVTSVTGTANQVAVATGTTTPVISLIGPYTPATYAAHGVLLGEGTSSIVASAVGTTGQVLTGVTGSDPVWAAPATGGTVTSVSVVSANGFAGTVATSTSTPAITLSTTITGVLSGNGTAITGSAITQYDVLVGGATNAITSITPSTSGFVLTSNGVSANPTFQAPATSGTVTSVSGTANQVAVATGTTTPVISLIGPYTPSTYTAHTVLLGEGTSSIGVTAVGATGQVLTGVTGSDPVWAAPATATITWTDEAVSFNALANNGYFVTATATATLPASPSQGNTIYFVVDSASGILTIQANTGQIIVIGKVESASAGIAVSNFDGDSIALVYRAADTSWNAIGAPEGTWTTT